jgi:hypothetical protein
MPFLRKENYNNRSFVVRGDTKTFKSQLKALGGRWNPNLKGGEGWIFSINQHTDSVEKFVQTYNEHDGVSDAVYACYILVWIMILYMIVFRYIFTLTYEHMGSFGPLTETWRMQAENTNRVV